jgi:putative ABC transport system permease protein
MFKNYLKIALRNLLKNKVYSLINILGLAIGLATSLLITLYVVNEWSYDRFNEHADRTYRVVQTMESESRTEEQASTPFPLAPTIDAEFPNLVESSVRFFDMQEPNHTFLHREKKISFREKNFYFVDSTFFNVFSCSLIRGNPAEALKNPLSLVITAELARKFFGDEDPMGQTLSYKGIRPMTITGIMKPWPQQSHMAINALASFTSLNEIYKNSPNYDESWLWNPVWTYVLLKYPNQAEALRTQLSTLEDKYYRAAPGWPDDESITLNLQKVTDIHLNSHRDQEMQPNSSILYLYILVVVAAFVLVIACINFMNLSTARSLERSREVGMRKVFGGYKRQLFYQFVGESMLIAFLAIIIGVVLVWLALPYFNLLTGKELVFSLTQSIYTIPALLVLTALVGIFSGLYPALFLSSFNPIEVLKGNTARGKRGNLFRKALVTFQFTLSVILIIGTAIIYLQLDFIQTKDLGFDKDHVLILPTKQNLIAWEFEAFKQKALKNTHVKSVTGIGKIPGSETQEYYRFVPAGNNENQDELNQALHVTYDAVETLGLKVLAGRSFSKEYSTDPDQAVIINRKMMRKMGFINPNDALGQPIYFYGPDDERETYSVIGVVEDFNYTSIKKEIEPLVLKLVQGIRPILSNIEYTAVKIAPGNTAETLTYLGNVWKEVNYIDPFEYQFLDDRLADVYKPEATMSSLSTSFSLLCILIACLGLLGLASYSAQLRQKEIGIRKSLGASVPNIMSLLSKDYLVLVLIANLMAWPLTYYFAAQWLGNFPYRFNMNTHLPFIFLGAGLLILILALATVSYHSIKAALINPVSAIQSE